MPILTTEQKLSSDNSTTSTTFVDSDLDITGLNSTATWIFESGLACVLATSGATAGFKMVVGGIDQGEIEIQHPGGSGVNSVPGLSGDGDKITSVKIQFKVSSGNVILKGTSNSYEARLVGIGLDINSTPKITSQRDSGSSSTTSTTFVDSNLLITLANRTSGKFLSNVSWSASNGIAGAQTKIVLGGTDDHVITFGDSTNEVKKPNYLVSVGDLDGSVIKVQFKSGNGARTHATTTNTNMEILEVSL